MKQAFRTFGLVCALVVVATLNPAAQTASIQGDVLKDWTALKDTTMKIADKMPEDKFGFKAHPTERSYGEQVLHIAQVNLAVLKSLNGKATAPTIDAKATSKADVLKAMADSFDYGTALIKEQTDQAMLENVAGPRFLGSGTRARMFYFLVGHTWDIYGQMAVYLRLNGLVPPASDRM